VRVRIIGALLALLLTIVCILASVEAPSSHPAGTRTSGVSQPQGSDPAPAPAR